MEIFPSIDILDGKVVRLMRGDFGRPLEYGDDPAATAAVFASAGAEWIHVVDLGAARTGLRTAAEAVQAIVAAAGRAKVQLGGGIRDELSIRRAMDLGAARVVVGSAALDDWEWFWRMVGDCGLAPRLALGLDAREGRLAARGWMEQTDTPAVEVAARVRGSALGAIIHTDIARDGMLGGPNLSATAGIIEASGLPVVASGGVSTLDDVRRCRGIGCAGAIIGRAYYEGKINLIEAIAEGRKPADGGRGGIRPPEK